MKYQASVFNMFKQFKEQIPDYLVYSCTEDKIAFFIPLKSKDGTFMLAECTRQITYGKKQNLLVIKCETAPTRSQ